MFSPVFAQIYFVNDSLQSTANVRPLRIEYRGALYHITDRGNERKAIFRDNVDRRRLIRYLAEAIEKFDLKIRAFCLMANHYHLEVETSRGNISQAMHWLK